MLCCKNSFKFICFALHINHFVLDLRIRTLYKIALSIDFVSLICIKMAAVELTTSQSDLIEKYQGILDKNKIHERVEQVVVTQPSLKGEHFASVCLYITLHFESGGSRELFIKQLPTNEVHLFFLKNMRLFEKEAGFFNTLLPAMQKYAGVEHPMDFFAKCLHADETQIIFENLVKAKGYYLVSKLERQNLDQVELTLKNLAEFHAIGYTMINEAGGPEAFRERYPFLFETVFLEDNPMLSGMFENGVSTACDLLENNKVPGRDKVLKNLSKFKGTLISLVCGLVGLKSEHLFHVVNHGDCWNNNMLFCNDPDTGKVKHGVLVDLQITRLVSPAVDIMYYLCTSMPTALRRKNWSRLLRFYYDALKNAIERLNRGNPSKFPYTFDQFLDECRAKFPIGFFIGISFAVVGDIMSEIDFGQMPKDADPNEYFKNILNQWIAKHPAKAEQATKEIVELWSEFEEVTQV